MAYNFESFQSFGKDQLEAAAAASSEVAKAFQAIAAEQADYAKKSFEDGSRHVEKLLGVKKIDEAFQLQSDYAKNAYEGFVAQAKKVGELYTDAVKVAMKPVEAAVAKAQGK
ncbi:MAG: phasin family protein [Hyphomicrobiales bacterium]|nr:phasin family protein [Hyphomicrobiales bacterium]